MKLIKFLSNDIFAVSIAIASVLLQSPHSFEVFYWLSSLVQTPGVSRGFGIAQAVLFAGIIDLFILYATVRNTRILEGGTVNVNRKDSVAVAKIFAWIVFVINCIYYFKAWWAVEEGIMLFLRLGVGVFIAGIIPFAMWILAEEIKVKDLGVKEPKKRNRAKKEVEVVKPETHKELKTRVIKNGFK